jgi:hypothetical protein
MTPFTGTFYIVVQRHSGRAIDPSKPFEAVITPEHNQVSFHQIVLDIDDGQHGTPAQIIEVNLPNRTAIDVTWKVHDAIDDLHEERRRLR